MTNLRSSLPNGEKGPNCSLGCLIPENVDHIFNCDALPTDRVDDVAEKFGEYPEEVGMMAARLTEKRESVGASR